MKRVAGASVVLLSSLALLTGCGSSADLGPIPQQLGGASYALYFSAQSADIDGAHHRGRLVLVDADGSVSVLPTWGMDHGRPVWTDEGLFFSDLKNDYRLDETRLTTIASPKTDSQYAMLATSPSTVLGLYNLGFSDAGGYTSQVVVTTGDTSTLSEVEGGYYTTANCEGTVYGIGLATGPYSSTGDPDTEPVMLNQLTDTADGNEENVGLSAQAHDNALPASAPCQGGTIFYISDSISGGLDSPVRPVISMWDIASGEYREVAMDAGPLTERLMRSDGIGYPQVSADSIRDGRLQWFGVSNSIMSTDLATGRTEKQFDVAGVTDEVLSSQASFQGDEVVVMVDSDGSNPYEIVRYHRDSGVVLSRTVVNFAPEDLAAGLFLRGFAVRP